MLMISYLEHNALAVDLEYALFLLDVFVKKDSNEAL
jgi:hypothetical protein